MMAEVVVTCLCGKPISEQTIEKISANFKAIMATHDYIPKQVLRDELVRQETKLAKAIQYRHKIGYAAPLKEILLTAKIVMLKKLIESGVGK